MHWKRNPGPAFLTLVLASAAVTSVHAAPAPPAEAQEVVVRAADRFYPIAAQHAGVAGETRIACPMTGSAKAEDCQILTERPAGFGFGEAARRMAPGMARKFDVSTPTAIFPIRFAPSAQTEKTPPLVSAQWAEAPSAADIQERTPHLPFGGKVHLALLCRVQLDLTVDGCVYPGDSSIDRSFIDAAKALAPSFRLAPQGRHGSDLEGEIVQIPFRFGGKKGKEEAERQLTDFIILNPLDNAAVNRVFPQAAARAGVRGGRGVAACTVAAGGKLTQCAPLSADPPNVGFALSAAQLAPQLRISTWTAEGEPVDGAKVKVAFDFGRR
jgi:hypothetical protein